MFKLAICSHRGPVAYRRTGAGLQARAAGPGGLVAAVAPAAARLGATWFYAASSEGDREVARRHPAGICEQGMTLRPLDLPGADHRAHYEVISCGLLAPLFHYMFSLTYAPVFTRGVYDAWAAYRRINDVFADAVCAVGTHAVAVEDTQLMLVGAALRARANPPDVRLAYFHHVPWCDPSYFAVLPEALRQQILGGMLAYDSVGFHCRRWADAFTACCERFLSGACRDGDHVRWQGRLIDVAVMPAAIDIGVVRACAASVDAEMWRERFGLLKGDERSLFVRVERADPSKNAIRGLRAYELLLERCPDLVATTQLLAVLTPVRGWVPALR